MSTDVTQILALVDECPYVREVQLLTQTMHLQDLTDNCVVGAAGASYLCDTLVGILIYTDIDYSAHTLYTG
jgi:hypothetical protein